MAFCADYVQFDPAILSLIPKAAKAEVSSGEFKFGKELRLSSGALERLAPTLELFRVTALSDDVDPQVSVKEDASLGTEAFRLEITPEKILVTYGDKSGKIYALSAVEQLLYLGFRYGADQAFLECGIVEDKPRFSWRAVMLDSARHFQRVSTIVRLLKAMGRIRLNRFHWHLVDNQGWRCPSDGAPKLTGLQEYEPGCYTCEEIALIRKTAAENGIEIIPEIDYPGHNHGAVSLYPELRCQVKDSEKGNEICLGSQAAMDFVKARYSEVFALFPESRYFHIGGDEAWDGWWRQCPVCQAKMKELGLESPRKLEEWFMRQVSQFVLDNGRIPISWRTNAILTPQNILQCWGNPGDMYGCAYHDQGKNLVIASNDCSYYMDYPQSTSEPRMHWMTYLNEESVYGSNPAYHMGAVLGDRLIGLECPLWTEVVPDWRVGVKFFPRLVAAAESAWTCQPKNYNDYLNRRQSLDLAGYLWW